MAAEHQRPKTEDRKPIVWQTVNRVLVVKLRSIGDAVLATPSLVALRRFLPDAQIDILLEDWVAPLLDGADFVDEVITVGKGFRARADALYQLRRSHYDVVFNLHGGTTATFFTVASGARHRVGCDYYQYSFLYNHLLLSAAEFWKTEKTHSAEQQLALIGFVGVPVEDRPRTRLVVTETGRTARVSEWHARTPYAFFHPTSAFFTKRWPIENFARVAEHLDEKGIKTVAIGSKNESELLYKLKQESQAPIATYNDLTLPEITALAQKARLFVGNDSGIAHIAAAVATPSVVIFGSSNRDHWHPWTDAPNETVYRPFDCQPCPGYECKAFGDARCITSIAPDEVIAAIDRLL